MSYLVEVPGTSGISSTPVTQLGTGNGVIYASNGLPVSSQPVSGITPGPRDSNNRLYVLKDDYISRDANTSNLTFPINARNFAGVDDGIVPTADAARNPVNRRVEKEGSEGWRAGRIIEDRAKYGPTGALAVDTIPSSVVSAITGQPVVVDTNPWPVRAAIGAGLLLAIALLVNASNGKDEKEK